MNGEITGSSSAPQARRDAYVEPATDIGGPIGADARERDAADRYSESLRRLAHELRNCAVPIVNAVHLIRLRGNDDAELTTLVDMIDRQVAAIIRILNATLDADPAGACTPAVIPRVATEADIAEVSPIGDATFANGIKLTGFGASRASFGYGEEATPLAARRILVADDSTAMRDSLAAVLLDLGHDVRLAADGIKALEVAEEWRPEFVILDVYMPAVSGYEVARRLRAKFTPAVMQLVMMSGVDLDETTLARAKRAGFDHCIDKTAALTGLYALLHADPASRAGVAVPGGEIAAPSTERPAQEPRDPDDRQQ